MKKVVDFQGKKVEGEAISFKLITPEQWNDYQLADGTVLRVKTILGGVVRLPEFAPDGDPIYVITTQNHVTAWNVPEELRKRL
jgi:hypothetical protein